MKQCICIPGLLLLSSLISGCQVHSSTPSLIAFTIILLIIALFLVLANYSNILRDEVSDCDEFNEKAQQLKQKRKTRFLNTSYPFSLSKVQFGVWTVIIASSYTYLSLCRGDCAEGPINKTALVLMGIFAGTAAASAIIDKREISDNRSRHQNSPSEGFFIDILSDENGISLHRFQNFVWTVIAITVYINKVYNTKTGCVLPELSDTLLALTGISSATFLVLRARENDPPLPESDDTTSAVGNKKLVSPDGITPLEEAKKT